MCAKKMILGWPVSSGGQGWRTPARSAWPFASGARTLCAGDFEFQLYYSTYLRYIIGKRFAINIVFLFRSATFNRRTRECLLSDMDRHTTSSVTAFVVSDAKSHIKNKFEIQKIYSTQPSLGSDYMESNCAPDPVSVCNFKQVRIIILSLVEN